MDKGNHPIAVFYLYSVGIHGSICRCEIYIYTDWRRRKSGADTVLRDDDKPETVQKRLAVYHEQTQPLIEYYDKQGILKSVDGTKPMDEVFSAIVGILGE